MLVDTSSKLPLLENKKASSDQQRQPGPPVAQESSALEAFRRIHELEGALPVGLAKALRGPSVSSVESEDSIELASDRCPPSGYSSREVVSSLWDDRMPAVIKRHQDKVAQTPPDPAYAAKVAAYERLVKRDETLAHCHDLLQEAAKDPLRWNDFVRAFDSECLTEQDAAQFIEENRSAFGRCLHLFIEDRDAGKQVTSLIELLGREKRLGWKCRDDILTCAMPERTDGKGESGAHRVPLLKALQTNSDTGGSDTSDSLEAYLRGMIKLLMPLEQYTDHDPRHRDDFLAQFFATGTFKEDTDGVMQENVVMTLLRETDDVSAHDDLLERRLRCMARIAKDEGCLPHLLDGFLFGLCVENPSTAQSRICNSALELMFFPENSESLVHAAFGEGYSRSKPLAKAWVDSALAVPADSSLIRLARNLPGENAQAALVGAIAGSHRHPELIKLLLPLPVEAMRWQDGTSAIHARTCAILKRQVTVEQFQTVVGRYRPTLSEGARSAMDIFRRKPTDTSAGSGEKTLIDEAVKRKRFDVVAAVVLGIVQTRRAADEREAFVAALGMGPLEPLIARCEKEGGSAALPWVMKIREEMTRTFVAPEDAKSKPSQALTATPVTAAASTPSLSTSASVGTAAKPGLKPDQLVSVKGVQMDWDEAQLKYSGRSTPDGRAVCTAQKKIAGLERYLRVGTDTKQHGAAAVLEYVIMPGLLNVLSDKAPGTAATDVAAEAEPTDA